MTGACKIVSSVLGIKFSNACLVASVWALILSSALLWASSNCFLFNSSCLFFSSSIALNLFVTLVIACDTFNDCLYSTNISVLCSCVSISFKSSTILSINCFACSFKLFLLADNVTFILACEYVTKSILLAFLYSSK